MIMIIDFLTQIMVLFRWLGSWGPEWGLLADGDSFIFIENHDSERGYGGVLTYKEFRPYKAAIAFLLAHPYGEPQVMSSFDFWDFEDGPPMNSEGNIISPAINSVSSSKTSLTNMP